MYWGIPAVAVVCAMAAAGCARREATPVEDLRGGRDTSRFALTSIQGTRDGERLDVRAVYGDGTGEIRVDLHFVIGSPTRLQSGEWTGADGEGSVRERSITFLGGQSGPPSLGGRFDLVGRDETARYRVTIPLEPLKDRL